MKITPPSGSILGGRQHGFAMYDGLVNIFVSNPDLQKTDDDISIRDCNPANDKQYGVLEFKHFFENVIEDFDNRKKNPGDIDLLVCWNIPEMNVSRGTLTYCYGDKKDLRQFYACTHIWHDENDTSVIPVISLKHVCAIALNELETRDGSPGVGTARFQELLLKDQQSAI